MIKKKKFLMGILCLLMVVFSIFGLSACDVNALLGSGSGMSTGQGMGDSLDNSSNGDSDDVSSENSSSSNGDSDDVSSENNSSSNGDSAHEHEYKALVTAPTCTEQGFTTHTCACGDSYVDTYVSALEHNFTNYISDGNATCTTDGTKTATCSRQGCGETDIKTDENSAGHDIVTHPAKTPTCEEIGWNAYDTCNRCNYSTYSELAKTNTHNYGEWLITKEPTQTQVGMKQKTCFVCNSVVSADIPMIEQAVFTYNDETIIGLTAYGKTLQEVVIPKEFTAIGYRAFYNCDNLENVFILDSVTSIGNQAFYDCDNLENVFIPVGVTTIGASAFARCCSLTSITIPDSVTSIGEDVFYNCGSLTDIVIPDSVTSIGEDAFYNCGSLTDIVIPDSVTSIGSGAFGGCGLTSVTIGNGVTTIGNSAFYRCSNLTSITIPDNVTTIDSCAFNYCDSLQKVNYTGTIDGWAQIEFNDSPANPLYYAKKLYINEIEVTEANITTATKISKYVFYNCDSLTSITISDSVTSIGAYAFGDPYHGCDGLKKVNYTGTIDGWVQIEFGNSYANPLYYAKKLYINEIEVTEVNITTATKISQCAFIKCSLLTSITVSDSVTRIGSYAFDDCDGLKKVNYTGTIDGWAQIEFGNSYANPLYYAKKLYINEIEVTEANITTATKISQCAFIKCSLLTSITISDSVTSIGANAFGDASNGCYGLKKVNYTGTIDGWAQIEFGNSYANPLYYAKKLYINEIEVTEANITTATKISQYAFYNYSSLTSITIPDSVTTIGDCAFFGCESLTSVTMGNSVTTIGDFAFSGCESLTSITIPDSVTSIGSYAFSSCESLTSVTIGLNVTSIARGAFYACESLTSVIFKNASGRWHVKDDGQGKADLSGKGLADSSSKAAMYLKDTYSSYDWSHYYP